MKIKKGDFIEIDYIGTLDDHTIFDLTSAHTAQDKGVYNPQASYGSRIICVGEQQIVKGLDAFLIDKDTREYDISLQPDDAFGKKDSKLIKIMPMQTFIKQRIKPMPGLQVNIDGIVGVIKSVSGGRVIIDFNHPLAGRSVHYHIIIHTIITDTHRKLSGFLKSLFGQDIPCTITKDTAALQFQLPKEMHDALITHIKKLIPELTTITITAPLPPPEKTPLKNK